MTNFWRKPLSYLRWSTIDNEPDDCLRLYTSIRLEGLGWFHCTALAVLWVKDQTGNDIQTAGYPAHQAELDRWYAAADNDEPFVPTKITAPDGVEREYVITLFPFCGGKE